MTDDKGVLNPGLMPQTLDDLHRVAPARVEVDDQVVGRWNRIADIWRTDVEFRESVLRYATRNAHRDPASAELWPEVVYPLIERARWHRRSRTGAEALWDNLCARLLHVPDAGVRLDRAIHAAVPAQVVEKLDLPPDAFEDDPQLGADAVDAPDPSADRLAVHPRRLGVPRRPGGRRGAGRSGRGRAGGPRPAPLHPGGTPRPLAGGARPRGQTPGAGRGRATAASRSARTACPSSPRSGAARPARS